MPHNRWRCLDRAYEIDGWTLRPGERRLREFVRSEPHSLAGVVEFESWPIIVEGRDPTSSFDPGVHERLHQLVCLLALAWDEPWQLRSSPWPIASLPPEVPESWPFPLGHDDFDAGPRAEPHPLPQMIGDHWPTLGSRGPVRRACSVWHQALLAQELHPSLALVAYLAALDALADKSLGSRRRVLLVAEEFGTEEQHAQLRRLYKQRSATVHDGVLGLETTFGVLADFGAAATNGATKSSRDLLGSVFAARAVSRVAVMRALTNDR